MEPKKYMTIFLGALILTALVAATGGTLLTNIVALNGTFGTTGLGTLFSATILGLLFAVFIFYALYRMFAGKSK